MSERERPKPLSAVVYWLLILVFGLVTSALIRGFDFPALPRLDLLGLAAGSAALLTALVWFFALGLQRSPLWGLAFLVPYVNLMAASYYARWYWKEGARAPALLALAGMVVQTIASLRVLSPPLPPLV